jgi:hypothetical protein
MGPRCDLVENDAEAGKQACQEKRRETLGGWQSAGVRATAGKELTNDLGDHCAAFYDGTSGITDFLRASRRRDPDHSDLRSGGARDP